jgi:hypothetical protein
MKETPYKNESRKCRYVVWPYDIIELPTSKPNTSAILLFVAASLIRDDASYLP